MNTRNAADEAPAETAVTPSGDDTWQRRQFAMIAGVGVLEAIARAQVPQAQDIYWEARYGMDLLSKGRIPRTDTYSWPEHGVHWVPSSWAWNVILGGVYDGLSVIGFWVLGVLGTVALALLVAAAARLVGARPLPTIVAFIPLSFIAELAMPRAQMVSNVAILVLPLMLRPLLYGERRAAIRTFALLAILQTAWMNLHSMALLGPAVIGAGSLALVAKNFKTHRWTGTGRAGVAIFLSTACCVITPYGWSQFTHAGEVRSASTGLIVEWDSVGITTGPQLVGLGAVLALIAIAVAAWRRGRADSAGALLLMAVLGASAIRFIPMGVLLAIPEIAVLLGRLDVRRQFFRFIVALGSVGLVVLAVVNWRDLRTLEPVVSPRLVALVPSGCRVLNDDLAGDALILKRPDVLVGLDGRNDMYGRAGVLRIVHLLDDRPGTDRALAADRVGCILAPTQQLLVLRLRQSPAWKVLGQDSFRTLLVRRA